LHISGLPPAFSIYAARWVAGQDVLRKQHQLAVRIDDLPVLGDDAEAVAVAVEGQPDFCVGILQRLDQVLQVFRMRRVRVVIRESAIHFAEQLDHLAAHAAIQVACKRTGYTVAAIDGNLDGARNFYIADDALQVLLADVVGAVLAGSGRRLQARFDGQVQGGDGIAMDCFALQHHLEAVVVWRVMAAGDHDAGAAIKHLGAEIHHRRGDDAQVDHVDAGNLQALRQCRNQAGAGQAAVAADNHAALSLGGGSQAEGVADGTCHAFIQRFTNDAANIVSLED
jgi:hypothetical protein